MIAAPSGPVCGRITVNSSPPKRDTTSISRTVEPITRPTSTSVRLPQRWPCWSFTLLNPSRSRKISDTGVRYRLLRSTSRRSVALRYLELKSFVRSSVTESSSDLFRRSRSEEHTSELQSRLHLVCRLLLEKKKKKPTSTCFLITLSTH